MLSVLSSPLLSVLTSLSRCAYLAVRRSAVFLRRRPVPDPCKVSIDAFPSLVSLRFHVRHPPPPNPPVRVPYRVISASNFLAKSSASTCDGMCLPRTVASQLSAIVAAVLVAGDTVVALRLRGDTSATRITDGGPPLIIRTGSVDREPTLASRGPSEGSPSCRERCCGNAGSDWCLLCWICCGYKGSGHQDSARRERLSSFHDRLSQPILLAANTENEGNEGRDRATPRIDVERISSPADNAMANATRSPKPRRPPERRRSPARAHP